MNEFFVLKPEEGIRFGKKWAYAEVIDPVNYGEAEKCPVCGSFVSLKRWIPPQRMKLSTTKPEKWGDFLWGAGFPLIVSARFVDIYQAEGLKGIDEFSQSVEIIGLGRLMRGDIPALQPKYHLIHIPWGGANQDDIASNVRHKYPGKIKCHYCRTGPSKSKQDRVIIENGSWNGSDILTPRGSPVQFLVSNRFRSIAEYYKLRNYRLISADKYAYDASDPQTWTI